MSHMFRRLSSGKYPLTLAKCAPRKSVNSAIVSMKQNVWACETAGGNTSSDVNWKLLLISGLNFNTWVYVISNMYLWKFSTPFLVKSASSVRLMRLLKTASSTQYARNCWQSPWRGRKSSGLRTRNPCKRYRCSKCEPHVRLLVFDGRWYGDSPLRVSECALPHQLPVNFAFRGPMRDLYHETFVGSEIYVEGTFPRTALQLLLNYHYIASPIVKCICPYSQNA
jgi:hypothetical protein